MLCVSGNALIFGSRLKGDYTVGHETAHMDFVLARRPIIPLCRWNSLVRNAQKQLIFDINQIRSADWGRISIYSWQTRGSISPRVSSCSNTKRTKSGLSIMDSAIRASFLVAHLRMLKRGASLSQKMHHRLLLEQTDVVLAFF